MQSRRVRWSGYVTHVRDRRSAYKDLMGKSEGKRPLGRPRHRWEEYICEGAAWIDLTQEWDRRRGVNGNKPSGSIEFGEYTV
jgi:hypothetical protein